MTSKLAILAFILFSVSIKGQVQDNYYEVLSKDDITVYSLKNSRKDLIQYKAVMILKDISFNDLTTYLKNYQNYPQWVYNCNKSKLIKKEKQAIYLYQISKALWPYKNRDYILKINTTETKNNVIIDFNAANNILPLKQENVRINDFVGQWNLKQEKEYITVTIYGKFNPKMKMPNFVRNKYVQNIPYKTLLNLKNNLLVKGSNQQ